MSRVLVGAALGALLLVLLLNGLSPDESLRAIEAERTRQTQIEQAERTQREALAQDGQTERLRVVQSNQTERTYISAQSLMWLATEREATLRLVIVLLIVVIVAVAAVAVAVAVVRAWSSKGEVSDRRYLLSVRRQLPPGWQVIHDPAFGWIATDGEEFMLARDVRALLGR